MCSNLEQKESWNGRTQSHRKLNYQIDVWPGFKMNYPDEFHYETYEICYVIPNNVLYGINNDIYFVDTPIRLKE